MKVIDIFNVVLTNEYGNVDGVYSFLNKEDAREQLAEMHKRDLETIEKEDLNLEEDVYVEGYNYYEIHYGNEELYRGEVIHSILKMEEE